MFYFVTVLIPVCLLFGFCLVLFYIGVLVYEEIWSLFDKKFKKEVLKQRRLDKFEKFIEKNKLSLVFVSPLMYKDLNLHQNNFYTWLDWNDHRRITECIIDEDMKDYQFSLFMNNNFITSIEDIYE